MNVKFNRKIYTLDALKKSAAAYAEFAEFKIKKEGGYYEVGIALNDPDYKDVIGREFANYVIYRMVSNKE